MQFVQNHDLLSQQKALRKLIRRAERVNRAGPPRDEDEEEIEVNNSTSFYSTIQRRGDQLRAHLARYKFPIFTPATFHSYTESHRMLTYEQNMRKYEACIRKGEEVVFNVDSMMPPAEVKTTVQDGLATFGLSPVDRQVIKAPLKYQSRVKLRDFENCLVLSPVTKLLHVFESLTEVLNKAEERGLDDVQLTELLILILKDYFPSLTHCTIYQKDLNFVFETLLSTLDPSQDSAKIQNIIQKKVRKVGQPISEFARILVALETEKQYIQTPFAAEETLKNRAEGAIKKILPMYLEKNCQDEFKNYRKLMSARGEGNLQLKQIVAFLAQLEQSDTYALKADKGLPPNATNFTAFSTVQSTSKLSDKESKRQSRRDRSRQNRSGSRGSQRSGSRGSSTSRDRSGSATSRSSVGSKSSREPSPAGKTSTSSERKSKPDTKQSSRSSGNKSKDEKKDKPDSGGQDQGPFCAVCYKFCRGQGEKSCQTYPGVQQTVMPCDQCGAGHHPSSVHQKKSSSKTKKSSSSKASSKNEK